MGKKKGFTLVELIAVIGITAIFGAIVLGISITSGKLFTMTQSQAAFNDEARLVLSMLEEDLRLGKEIEIKTLNADGTPKFNGSSSITINGITDTCSNFNLPAGPFDIILTLNVKGDLYYYIKVGDRIERKKFGGAAFTSAGSGIEKIEKVEIKKIDKRYLVSIKFKNSNGEMAEYKSAVMPRNQR